MRRAEEEWGGGGGAGRNAVEWLARDAGRRGGAAVEGVRRRVAGRNSVRCREAEWVARDPERCSEER